MTENLLQKLEEKMLMLFSEIEFLRKEVNYLKHENTSLKSEQEKYLLEKSHHESRLQDLISLLDSVNLIEKQLTQSNIAA